jgi:hypothetical protein
MIHTLTVCLALSGLMGTCAKYIHADFKTLDQCMAVLKEFKSQPAFSYGYCEQKEKK